jgi:hypothetical protein
MCLIRKRKPTTLKDWNSEYYFWAA